MAFRLTRRSIPKQLRRLVRTQLDLAIERLEGVEVSEADIHEARMHIKKTRAILKLLEPALGSSYAKGNDPLRASGRELGRVRDPEAMTETLGAIRGRYSEVISKATAQQVDRGLRGEHVEAQHHAGGVAKHAVGILKKSREKLPDLVAGAGGFSSVRTGVASVYKRSRSLLADLSLESEAVAFHAWRRRVKEHWYHVRLFEALHSSPRQRARSLKSLERELGEEHNLALLSDELLKSPERFGDARSTGLVLGCIQKRRRALRKKALSRGRQLFSDKAKKVEATIRKWWRGKR